MGADEVVSTDEIESRVLNPGQNLKSDPSPGHTGASIANPDPQAGFVEPLDVMNILFVEDDLELRQEVSRYLEHHGCHVTAVDTAKKARTCFTENMTLDLVLLDVMLPGEDGYSFCKWLREHQHTLPIIFISAWGETTERIVGLELGADDFLTKPFSPRELLARIRTLHRRQEGFSSSPPPSATPESSQPEPDSRDGDDHIAPGLVINRMQRRAFLDNKEVRLTGMQYELLQVFASRPGEIITRGQLLHALRGWNAEVYGRTVDVNISRLRRQLGDDAVNPRLIRTLWGKGYIFMGHRLHNATTSS